MKIFLNYAKEDKELVDELFLKLIRSGFKPWMDKPPKPFQGLGIKPGEKWKDVLQDEISKCDLFIACLSKISVNKKGFVQQEYRWALEQMNLMPNDEIYLLPLLLENTNVPNIKLDGENFKNIQWYEYYSRGYEDLEKFLKSKIEPKKVIEWTDKKDSIFIAASWKADSSGFYKPNNYAICMLNKLREKYLDKIEVNLISTSIQQSNVNRQLYNQLDKTTIGITILTKDDVTIDGKTFSKPNVLFELGYMYSKLGPERNLLIVENGVSVPSNITDMVRFEFEPNNFVKVFPNIQKYFDLIIK